MDPGQIDRHSRDEWTCLTRLLDGARNQVDLLEISPEAGARALAALGLAPESALGAVAQRTGGLLVDHGWLRIVGADGGRMDGLPSWNRRGPDSRQPDPLLVAHDAVGGFFGLARTDTPDDGTLHYFAPDTLRWEAMRFDYGRFLAWALTADLSAFYRPFRWQGWEGECQAIEPNRGFSIYPFLWASEGGPVSSRSRRAVPMSELWELHNGLAAQLDSVPDGTAVDVRLIE